MPTPCPAGSVQDSPRMASCQLCAAGSYQPGIASQECIECPARYFCLSGASTPEVCPPGTYSVSPGLPSKSSCRDCTAGHWCTGGLLVECGEGTWNGAEKADSALFCEPCPLKSSTFGVKNATKRTDCHCDPGYYLEGFSMLNLSEATCLICPIGAVCREPSITRSTLPVAEGFFRMSDSADIRICPDADESCASNASDSKGDESCAGTSACAGTVHGTNDRVGSEWAYVGRHEPVHYRYRGNDLSGVSGLVEILRKTQSVPTNELDLLGLHSLTLYDFVEVDGSYFQAVISPCRTGLSGAFCRLCSEDGRYFQKSQASREAACLPCSLFKMLEPLWILAVLLGCEIFRRLLVAWLRELNNVNLRSKIKILTRLCQLVIRVPEVYEVNMWAICSELEPSTHCAAMTLDGPWLGQPLFPIF